MANKTARRRKTVKRRHRKGLRRFFIVVLFVVIASFVFNIVAIDKDVQIIATPDTKTLNDIEFANLHEEIKKIDFHPVVEAWANSIGGRKSVLIYDLDREEVASSYNAKQNYNTASLYKLFVVYEGYRRVERGDWNGSERVWGTNKTMLDCLDLAIRESNSICAESLWAMIGQEELEKIIQEDYDILNSNIKGLESNVEDIAKIMQRFYSHPEITKPELLTKMWDSFLNQPTTTYNWRQGLPSGFSDKVEVYDKVGWDFNGKSWNVYHDAAIVIFPEQERHFIVVVMTNGLSEKDIRNLGTRIEETFNQ